MPVKVLEVMDNGAIIVQPIRERFAYAVLSSDLIVVSDNKVRDSECEYCGQATI
jgi:hypothetical protein